MVKLMIDFFFFYGTIKDNLYLLEDIYQPPVPFRNHAKAPAHAVFEGFDIF